MQLRAAELIANVGSWTFDPASMVVTWSEGLRRVIGVTDDEPPSFETFVAMMDPETSEKNTTESSAAVARGEGYVQEFTIHTPLGLRWVRALGMPMVLDGVPSIVGVLHDITKERLTLQRVRDDAYFAAEHARQTQDLLDMMTASKDWG